jgi:hypothetical protein
MQNRLNPKSDNVAEANNVVKFDTIGITEQNLKLQLTQKLYYLKPIHIQ